MKNKFFGFFLLMVLVVPVLASPVKVAVTLAPQAEFVEQVGGRFVDVFMLVPPGSNPHVHELTPKEMRQLKSTQLYVKVGSGIDFEIAWVDKIIANNPHLTVINNSERIRLQRNNVPHEDQESDEAHHHAELDPHVWLSPLNAMIMVNSIKEALISLDPDHRDHYIRNAEQYSKEISKTAEQLKSMFFETNSRKFYVQHPSWGYFAEYFGLEQIPLEFEGKEPSARDLISLVKQAKQDMVKLIFASPQFNPRSAQIIAGEINGNVILIDPLAKDYLNNLHKVATAITR